MHPQNPSIDSTSGPAREAPQPAVMSRVLTSGPRGGGVDVRRDAVLVSDALLLAERGTPHSGCCRVPSFAGFSQPTWPFEQRNGHAIWKNVVIRRTFCAVRVSCCNDGRSRPTTAQRAAKKIRAEENEVRGRTVFLRRIWTLRGTRRARPLSGRGTPRSANELAVRLRGRQPRVVVVLWRSMVRVESVRRFAAPRCFRAALHTADTRRRHRATGYQRVHKLPVDVFTGCK